MASYTLAAIVVALGAVTGVLAWRYVLFFFVFAAAVCIGLYLFFRSGLNLRFADPSFIRTQNLLPLAPLLFLLYHTASDLGRAALLIVSLSGLLYGALNLDIRRFLTVMSTYVAGYCCVFLILSIQNAVHVNPDPGEWMILAAVAFFMLQMGLLGSYIVRLRDRLARHHDQIAEMATRDELTGSYNRRFLIDALSHEPEQSDPAETYCVCLMDVDHFKRINDQYGHSVGDDVLCRCATAIQADIRDIDTFGRYGGEEFLLILPRIRDHKTITIAERLRVAIESLVFEADHRSFGVTLSIGVAESRLGEPYATLLKRADEALYRAKNSGRNRVCRAETGNTADAG